MKKALLLTFALMLGASLAFAQGGSIGLYKDTAGTDCWLNDTTSGLTPYYVVHLNTTAASAAEFSAPKPACVMATFLSDAAVYPVTVGGSQTGVSIGYGSCKAAPIHILTLNFFTMGMTPQCCLYPVLPHPVNGGPWMVDCSNNQLPAAARIAVVNGNLTCTCEIVPTEETTWGGVKALYE
jgi:hypothetical protein